MIISVCCYLPVAAYAPSQTNESTQEIFQESLQNMKVEKVKCSTFYYNIPLSTDIQDYIFALCTQYELSIPLIVALIDLETEGLFDNDIRHKNSDDSVDFGLMQLNSNYHTYFGELIEEPEFDPSNIYHNLHAGIKQLFILKEGLKEHYSDEELKIRYLNQYNLGVNGYRQYVRETGRISRGYSDRVLEKQSLYENEKENILNESGY
jgi:hypothetical protein